MADIIKNEVHISENGNHDVFSWDGTDKDKIIQNVSGICSGI